MRHPTPLVEIVSTGRYLPDNVVTNDDLAKRMDTSDEWIRSRTGIGARRIAPDDVSAATMAAEAGRRAMEGAGIDPGEGDYEIQAIDPLGGAMREDGTIRAPKMAFEAASEKYTAAV